MPKNWKLSQLIWLQVNYLSFDIDKAVAFIGKSKTSIYEMKRKIGCISVNNWTIEQEKYLIENGAKSTSLLTNKSLNSCRIKLSRLTKKP